jgi:plastocyanin
MKAQSEQREKWVFLCLLVSIVAVLVLLVQLAPASGEMVAQEVQTVRITSSAFDPATVTVTQGTTIEWENQDTVTHTVTSQAELWDSGDIAPGATYTRTFDTVGMFSYFCMYDPGMTGTVRVMAEVYLPLVAKQLCVPSPPGESNNVADALIICSGQTVSGRVSDPDDLDDVYKIMATAGQQMTISMSGTGGDADLYLYPPGTTDVTTDPWVDSSENSGNSEFIQGTVQVGGYWYIDVFEYEYDVYTDYDLTVTLSGP